MFGEGCKEGVIIIEKVKGCVVAVGKLSTRFRVDRFEVAVLSIRWIVFAFNDL